MSIPSKYMWTKYTEIVPKETKNLGQADLWKSLQIFGRPNAPLSSTNDHADLCSTAFRVQVISTIILVKPPKISKKSCVIIERPATNTTKVYSIIAGINSSPRWHRPGKLRSLSLLFRHAIFERIFLKRPLLSRHPVTGCWTTVREVRQNGRRNKTTRNSQTYYSPVPSRFLNQPSLPEQVTSFDLLGPTHLRSPSTPRSSQAETLPNVS